MVWRLGERAATFLDREESAFSHNRPSLSLSSRDSHLPLLCHFIIIFSRPIHESRSQSHYRLPMPPPPLFPTFAANVANLTVHTLADRCQTCQNPHRPRPRLSRTFFLNSEFKSHRTFALYRTAFLALWSLLLFLPALPPCSSSFAVSPSFLAVRPIFAV